MKLLATCLLFTGFLLRPQAHEAEAKPPGHSSHELSELLEEARRSQRAYVPFLDTDSLSTGLYHLPAGTVDGQGPHELDEVYFVVAGKARFSAGSSEYAAEKGTVLYVERGVDHRFHDITEDLTVVVFFSKKLPERD